MHELVQLLTIYEQELAIREATTKAASSPSSTPSGGRSPRKALSSLATSVPATQVRASSPIQQQHRNEVDDEEEQDIQRAARSSPSADARISPFNAVFGAKNHPR